MLAPIQVRPKLHPIRRNLPQLAQLNTWNPPESVSIGRSPAHKPVNPTHPPHQLMPRPQIKMIGIRQDNLRPGKTSLFPRRCSSSRLCGTAFTLAAVPTGINTGVSTTPCGSLNRPLRPPPSALPSLLQTKIPFLQLYELDQAHFATQRRTNTLS